MVALYLQASGGGDAGRHHVALPFYDMVFMPNSSSEVHVIMEFYIIRDVVRFMNARLDSIYFTVFFVVC